ncbi:MAG: Alpha-xylosidase, partial [uncultured Sphingomonadaceae bacterium]
VRRRAVRAHADLRARRIDRADRPRDPAHRRKSRRPPDAQRLHGRGRQLLALSLYEDDGVSRQYSNGAFARIPLRYDEANGTL